MGWEMAGRVTAVSRNATYSFSKPHRESVTLLAGLGVEGTSTPARPSATSSG